MPWAKLDDHFAFHPKVIRAGPYAAWLYVCGLTYCACHLTDGFIPERAVLLLADVPDPMQLAERLVAERLWERVPNGFQVHDYLDYNPSGAAVREQRKTNARRQADWRAEHRTDDGRFEKKPAADTPVEPNESHKPQKTKPWKR